MIAARVFDGRRLLQSFSWKGFFVFIAFAAGLAAWTWSGALFKGTMTFDEHLEYFLSLFQRSLLNYFPAYVLVGLADGLQLSGSRRRIALGVALVAGFLLAVQVRCGVSRDQMFYVYDGVILPYCTAFPTWRTYIDFPAAWITPLATGAVVTIFIFTRRRDAELVEQLHHAHAGEIESRRQRIESEIEAMHSRVDPDKLLATLRAVQARYAAGLQQGEAMLDELIGDLRQAAGRPGTEGAGE
jgi:hypothetical protein